MTIISIGEYCIKVTKHNRNNCYIGEFIGNSKFPTIYGDNMKEIKDTAMEYIMEENSNKENNKNELCGY